MSVSVCIPTSRPDTVGATIRSLVQQTYRDFEVVVIAQGSAQGAIARIIHESMGTSSVRVVEQDGRGVSRARNALIGVAEGDLIAMLDDDCEAAPEWLETLVASFREMPDVGIVGGALVAPPKERRVGNCPASWPIDYVKRSGSEQVPQGHILIGANLAFTRAAANVVGAFDEYLGAGAPFPAAEELDWLWRATNASIPVRSTPLAVVNHTYGWRYGVRAVVQLQRSYARGNGALAAKWTLMGDPEGPAAVQLWRRKAQLEWWERRAPVALPAGLWRYRQFVTAYRECIARFTVGADGLLRERSQLT